MALNPSNSSSLEQLALKGLEPAHAFTWFSDRVGAGVHRWSVPALPLIGRYNLTATGQ